MYLWFGCLTMARMKIGDVEVFTISEAATRYGIGRKTLLTQIRRGILSATLSGHTYIVTSDEMERYVRDHKGKPGLASPSHPGIPPRKKGDDPAS